MKFVLQLLTSMFVVSREFFLVSRFYTYCINKKVYPFKGICSSQKFLVATQIWGHTK